MALKRGPKPGNAKGGKAPQSTALARVRAHEIAKSGKAPLDIMLDNMMFWHNQSQNIAEQIQSGIQSMKDGNASPELIKETEGLLKTFIAARENAQKCAVDAAPYVHPKLQSVAIKANNSGEKVIEVETLVASSGDRNEDVTYRKDYDASKVLPMRKPSAA